ncbi:MAG TPA: ABC transporter substrate-binding protein [Candidatus Aminicenantes bacterium]|nr:ABC transporter substrate-binding protein [Candidatus Aminicenantes bacterium]
MSRNARRLLAALTLPALALAGAIKPHYGGEIVVRLNEPSSFRLNTASYSNLILYSLIYENFFFLAPDGQISSNIFQEYRYDAAARTLLLTPRENLSFSNGKPLTAKNIQVSLKVFLSSDLFAASRLSKVVKNVRLNGEQVAVELLADRPDIVSLLTAPELVVLAEDEQSFSGLFYPQEWEKNQHLILRANPYYAGGRPYLDRVRVTFGDSPAPDLFLAAPGQFKESCLELDSGIYQNLYLCFLQPDIGQNTKIALFSLLKRFNEASGGRYRELSSLTSDDESPVAIRIKTLSPQKTAAILKTSEIRLYALSSLSFLEKDLTAFLKATNLTIETQFIDNSEFMAFLDSAAIKYVLVDRLFQRKAPPEEKLSRILKESSFNRFNAQYLRMLSELDEARFSNSPELLTEQIARISEAIVNDGFLFPLFQRNYSLYIRRSWPTLETDYYGRPLLQRVSQAHD